MARRKGGAAAPKARAQSQAWAHLSFPPQPSTFQTSVGALGPPAYSVRNGQSRLAIAPSLALPMPVAPITGREYPPRYVRSNATIGSLSLPSEDRHTTPSLWR